MALWGLGAKCWSGVDGWMDGYPLDCYDYESTCGANNEVIISNQDSQEPRPTLRKTLLLLFVLCACHGLGSTVMPDE